MIRTLQGLDKITLPIMPETGSELRRLLDLPSTRNHELQKVLLRDPAATIALFRRIEQSRPGAWESITDAAHALAMIGLDAFIALLDQLPLIKKSADRQRNPALAYSQCAHAACYARCLSNNRDYSENQEIAVASALQNPAVLALWQKDPASAARANNAVRDGLPYDVAFQAELGMPLDQANRQLAKAWAFPKLARETMGEWNPYNRNPQIVRMGDFLAQSSAAGWQHEDTLTYIELLADYLCIETNEATSWLHQKAAEAARSLHWQGYPLPAFELLLLPGGEETDHRPIPEFGRKTVPQQPAAKPDLQTIIGDIMQRMRQQAGLKRVFFAMPNQERSQLRTRLILGAKKDDPLRQLNLSLRKKHLFSLLMSKQQSLWMNAETKEKYARFLPPGLAAQVHPDSFYMMSLFVGEKPLGLIYADADRTDADQYKAFRRSCQEIVDLLGSKKRKATSS